MYLFVLFLIECYSYLGLKETHGFSCIWIETDPLSHYSRYSCIWIEIDPLSHYSIYSFGSK